MSDLSKEDLAKMNRPYIESLEHEALVDVAYELRNVVIEQLEILEKDPATVPSLLLPMIRIRKIETIVLQKILRAMMEKRRRSNLTRLKTNPRKHQKNETRAASPVPRDLGVLKNQCLKKRFPTIRINVKTAARKQSSLKESIPIWRIMFLNLKKHLQSFACLLLASLFHFHLRVWSTKSNLVREKVAFCSNAEYRAKDK